MIIISQPKLTFNNMRPEIIFPDLASTFLQLSIFLMRDINRFPVIHIFIVKPWLNHAFRFEMASSSVSIGWVVGASILAVEVLCPSREKRHAGLGLVGEFDVGRDEFVILLFSLLAFVVALANLVVRRLTIFGVLEAAADLHCLMNVDVSVFRGLIWGLPLGVRWV